MTATRREIGDLLVDNGVITPEELARVRFEKEKTGQTFPHILSRLGLAGENQLKNALELEYGVNFVSLRKIEPDTQLISMLPEPIIRAHLAVPIGRDGSRITVAMVDPADSAAVDDLKKQLNGASLKTVVCLEDDFEQFINAALRPPIPETRETESNGADMGDGLSAPPAEPQPAAQQAAEPTPEPPPVAPAQKEHSADSVAAAQPASPPVPPAQPAPPPVAPAQKEHSADSVAAAQPASPLVPPAQPAPPPVAPAQKEHSVESVLAAIPGLPPAPPSVSQAFPAQESTAAPSVQATAASAGQPQPISPTATAETAPPENKARESKASSTGSFPTLDVSEPGQERLGESDGEGESLSEQALARKAQEEAIVLLANQILGGAIKRHCSNIHITAGEKQAIVQYRLNGMLYVDRKLPRTILMALIARYKMMARMNLAERGLPQDGHIKVKSASKEIVCLVSTIPSEQGENVVIWIL